MLGTIDFRGTHQESADCFMLEVAVQQLVGQPFLQFRFSYGDEMTVHLGEPKAYSSPKMKHLTKGSYILALRASNWYLTAAGRPVPVVGGNDDSPQFAEGVVPLTPEAVERADYVKRDAIVTSVVISECQNGFALSLSFSDGSLLRVLPSHAQSPDTGGDVADWELFTPYQRVLTVGPGSRWCYLPSRQTETANIL